jgi:hypothetical protein
MIRGGGAPGEHEADHQEQGPCAAACSVTHETQRRQSGPSVSNHWDGYV